MRTKGLVAGLLVAAGAMAGGVMAGGAAAAQEVQPADLGDERHAGYYYPSPQTEETYVARARTLQEANRTLRLGFVTGFTQGQLEAPTPIWFVIYAKGADSEKMIITALEEGKIDTLYRARGLLAALTAMARQLPVFQEHGLQDWFTFFDLAKMLGFEQITISDGKGYAHRVNIE
ncbi:MAG: molybdopterin-guanine dinucleotide biosynthesis protein A [Tistlia sp.]|uniref:molybdopterin-guanine dinucleotide biosynthesis protein A n=1 Tax=Tistlia sp. TaxID=3057121 RepID=UPI0034A3203D